MKITSATAKQVLCSMEDAVFATTEIGLVAGSIADILIINRRYFTTEIEIKTDKQDLKKELNIIRLSLERQSNSIQTTKIVLNSPAKRFKHFYYLGIYEKRLSPPPGEIIPNKYCFAVPEGLIDVAVGGVKNTPYGVISLSVNECWNGAEILKRNIIRPKFIHREKILTLNKNEQRIWYKLLTRLCYVNQRLKTQLQIAKP